MSSELKPAERMLTRDVSDGNSQPPREATLTPGESRDDLDARRAQLLAQLEEIALDNENVALSLTLLGSRGYPIEIEVQYLQALLEEHAHPVDEQEAAQRVRDYAAIEAEYFALQPWERAHIRSMRVIDARPLVRRALLRNRSCSRPRGTRRSQRPRRNARTRPARARAPGRPGSEDPHPEPVAVPEPAR